MKAQVPAAKQLVLFDLDGVLWDSRQNMARAWQEVQRQFGVTVGFDAYFALIGRPFADIMAMLGLGDRARELEAAFRVASMANMALARFYPGAEDLVMQLRAAGLKLGVITSKDELRTAAILALLPVTLDVVKTPDGKTRGKPAPDHLLTAMAHAGVDPADTVYIGDMDSDYEAARRAGVDYAHASWGYGAVPPGCSEVLTSLADIIRYAPSSPTSGTVSA